MGISEIKGYPMFIFFIILGLSVILPCVHLLFFKNGKWNAFKIVEIFLLYQFVFNLGLLGILSFFGLTFMPETAAEHNGWPMCPFQQEMANVNLGFAVLGILCIWIRHHFWTASAIGASIWLFADGINHLTDLFAFRNYSAGNTGVIVYSDLLLPVVWMILLFFYHRLRKEANP